MQSVPITTDVVSSILDQGEVYNIVINFVSDLWQVGGFLQVLRFPPPINTDRHHNCTWNIVESGIKHHQTNKQINKLLNLKSISTFANTCKIINN
jgi:hypothetical protein